MSKRRIVVYWPLLATLLLSLSACRSNGGPTSLFASHAPLAKGVQLGRYHCASSLGGGWTPGPVILLYTGGFEITSGDTYNFVDSQHHVSGQAGSYSFQASSKCGAHCPGKLQFTSGTLQGSQAAINLQNHELYLVRAQFVGKPNANLAALSCWHTQKAQ